MEVNRNYQKVSIPNGASFLVRKDDLTQPKNGLVTVWTEGSPGHLAEFLKIDFKKKPKSQDWRSFIAKQVRLALQFLKMRDEYRNAPFVLAGEAIRPKSLFSLVGSDEPDTIKIPPTLPIRSGSDRTKLV